MPPAVPDAVCGVHCRKGMANMALIFSLQGPDYKGLCDVVHRAHLIAPYLVALLIVGGQKNYDGVRVLGLYQLAQLKTVPVRQVDVQQHQIKFPLADSFGCGSGI